MAVEENCVVDGRESSVAMATNCQCQNGGILPVGRLVVATNGASPPAVMGVREEPAIDTNNNNNTGEDDELTSLTWLQDTNLLKNFQMGACGIEGEDVFSDTPSSDYLDESIEQITLEGSIVEEEPLISPAEQPLVTLPSSGHMPYNPTLHANSKPPYSFSCLIFMAIEDSINKALPVKDIYNWILTHFPYFQNAPTGWKNSVRHNLSLSKCFRKVEKEKGQNIGKGSLWCIDPEYRPNLIQALQKAPSMANMEFSQLTHLSSTFCENGKSESDIKPCLLVSSQQAIKIPPPELFPFLSRRLAASNVKDLEVDAAATMLALKNGPCMTIQNFSEESEGDSLTSIQRRLPRKRLKLKHMYNAPVSKKTKVSATAVSPIPPVITSSPSEDHTYSASLSQPGFSSPSSLSPISNELHDWSEGGKCAPGIASNGLLAGAPQMTTFERSVATREFEDFDDYDDSSAAEGAHALMNLAKLATKRLLKNNTRS